MHDLGPAAREMTRLVKGVRDDQLGDPTPCTTYTLGDLLQHVRGLAEAFTLAGRKEQPDRRVEAAAAGRCLAAARRLA